MTEQKFNNGCAIALGNFDGLHIGHKKVLESTLAFSKEHNLEAKVMLFDIHPKEFLTGKKIPHLMTDEDEEAALRDMGFEVCRVSFAEIKDYSCEEFFKKIIVDFFNAKALCCGFNYSFGKNGAGNAETLAALCKENRILCNVAQPVSVGGMTVSSSAIRNFIVDGNAYTAAEMLGRPYAIHGEVIHGDARGRTLGFPTTNQKIDETLTVPKFGVYETRVKIDGKAYKGVTNIGIRPTYRAEYALAETHIIDFSDDIYGRIIDVELIRYIRPEVRFNSADELKAQLMKDIAEVAENV